ncbi:secretin receptor-like [Babylonia areolata]|uniref:secretin receptor-like n=1 Tax=Babylonia areolata TaxID=304850 RepID=UPI003FD133BD
MALMSARDDHGTMALEEYRMTWTMALKTYRMTWTNYRTGPTNGNLDFIHRTASDLPSSASSCMRNSAHLSRTTSVAVSVEEQHRRINEERRMCHQLIIQELNEEDNETDLISVFGGICAKGSGSQLLGAGRSYCQPVWDGIMCWPRTQGGQLVEQGCPDYVHGFVPSGNTVLSVLPVCPQCALRYHHRVFLTTVPQVTPPCLFDHWPSGMASRQCQEEGEWFFSQDFNRTWSNYSQCYRPAHLPPPLSEVMPKADLKRIQILYNVGYGLSLVTLLVAIVVMLYFRRLRCPRNTMHVNLFASFVLRALLSFLRDNLLVSHLGLPADVIQLAPGLVIFNEDGGTHWQCKLLFATFNYAVTASTMWIFVEGLYLHTLVIVAVFSERSHIRYYVLLGWGGPLIFIIPWVIVRATVEDEYCWNTHPTMAFFWILKTPLVLSVAVNFVFFLNIVRVLFTKLVKTAPRPARRFRYRRLGKSTLVLIPLFGVHYMLFLAVPEHIHPTLELVKLYYEMFFNSFQGFIVAYLFCFMNAEVRSTVKAEIRKKWIRYKLHANAKKFQKFYWQTSSSHLTRKQSRGGCYSHENSSSVDPRDVARDEAYSSGSDRDRGSWQSERRQLRVSMQQMRFNYRSPEPVTDVGVKEDFRPIVFVCSKRNSLV